MNNAPTPKTIHHDTKPTCQVVGAGPEFIGKQALSYAPGISAESVGAQRIHLQILTIPPGGQAKAHKHGDHETALLYPERRSRNVVWREIGRASFRSGQRLCLHPG